MTQHQSISTSILIESISRMILITLWAYSFLSKIINYQGFRVSILNQPFSNSFGETISIVIPVIEFLLLVMFFVQRLRGIAYLGSLVVLSIFSTYVGLVVLDAFEKIPCGCAGIFERIGWEAHFSVNAGLVGIAGIGCWFVGKKAKKDRRPETEDGSCKLNDVG